MQGASAAQRKKARLPKAILYSGLLFIAVYILALLFLPRRSRARTPDGSRLR